MLSYPHLSFHTLHFTLSIYFLYIFLNFSLINDKIRFEAIISILAFIQLSTITENVWDIFWLNIDFMHTELLACRIFSNKKVSAVHVSVTYCFSFMIIKTHLKKNHVPVSWAWLGYYLYITFLHDACHKNHDAIG